jgi:ABC-2 type transport system permease protein
MKGLLIKDLLVLRRYIKSLAGIWAVYLAFAFLGDSAGVMANFVMILCIMIPIASLSYDEQAGWNRLGASLPVSRREMVGAKYLLAILLSIAGAALTAMLWAILAFLGRASLAESLLTTGLLLVGGLIAISVLLPVVYRFGVEHSRAILAALFVLPSAIVFILYRLGVRISPSEQTFMLLAAASPLVAAAALTVSFGLSCRIFAAKEF